MQCTAQSGGENSTGALTSSCSVEQSIGSCEGTLADAGAGLQQLLHHSCMTTVGSIVQCCRPVGCLQVHLSHRKKKSRTQADSSASGSPEHPPRSSMLSLET